MEAALSMNFKFGKIGSLLDVITMVEVEPFLDVRDFDVVQAKLTSLA